MSRPWKGLGIYEFMLFRLVFFCGLYTGQIHFLLVL